MMDQLKNLRIVIVVIGVFLILILIRISDQKVFRGQVKTAVEAIQNNSNSITMNQVRKLTTPYLVIEIGSESRPDSILQIHSVQIPFERLLDKPNIERLDQTKGEIILYSSEMASASKAWIILNQLGYKNVLILTADKNSEELKYKFQPDTTARLEQDSL
jgi:hypothetical protein